MPRYILHALAVVSFLLSVLCGLQLSSAQTQTQSGSRDAKANAPIETSPQLVLDGGGHVATAWRLFLIDDQKTIVTLGFDNSIRFWDVATGTCVRNLLVSEETLEGIYAASLTRDNKFLAMSGPGNNIAVLSLEQLELVSVFEAHPEGNVSAIAFAPDGKTLMSGSSDSSIREWDWRTGKKLRTLQAHGTYVSDLAFSNDGSCFASTSNDGTCKIHDRQHRLIAETRLNGKQANCVAFIGDTKGYAVGWQDGAITIHNSAGSKIRDLRNEGHWIQEIISDKAGERLLFTTGWHKDAGPLCGVIDTRTGSTIRQFREQNNLTTSGAFFEGSDKVVTLGGRSEEVVIWHTSNGQIDTKLCSKATSKQLALWAPNGKSVAWGITSVDGVFDLTNFEIATAGPEIGSVDLSGWRGAVTQLGATTIERSSGKNGIEVKQAGKHQKTLQFENEFQRTFSFHCFTLLPGDRVATGGGSNPNITLFDSRSNKILREYRGHISEVFSISPSPDNRFLVSAGDTTIRIWNIDAELPLVSLFFVGEEWVAWTPEGYYAASAGGELLMGWAISNGPNKLATVVPANHFRKEMYKPELFKQLLRTGDVERALDAIAAKKSAVVEVLPPTVAITSPKETQVTVDTAEIVVAATASQVGIHPITSMQLIVDGRPLGGQGGIKRFETPKHDVTHSFTVPLKANERHRIEVRADSAVSYGMSKPIEVTFKRAESKRQLPNLYVLAVGVKDYEVDSLDLGFADEDAKQISATFRKHGEDLFKKVDTKLIVNEEATQRGILKGLAWLRSQMTQNDVGVIFFSGHGQRDTSGSFYLLPHDVDTDSLVATGVPDSQLKGVLQGTPGRLLLLVDACHAGSVNGDKRKSPVAITDDLVRDLATDDYGVVVMASSMGREFSLESSDDKAGYFTLALTEGLSGKADSNGDNIVYSNELDTYVSERVKALSKGAQHPVTAKPGTIRSFPLSRKL